MSVEELSPGERELVLALRAVPESPLRQRVMAFVAELCGFAAEPCCAEMQADGVPCTAAQASCDACRKVTALIDGLSHRLQAG
jgi:hypothetical protein